MNLISKFRLVNRAFITENSENDILMLSKLSNIPVVLGTSGNFEPGPFISNIYKSSKYHIEVSAFRDFNLELCQHLDLYSNTKPATYLEYEVYFTLSKDSKIVQGNINLVFYRENGSILWIATEDPILSIKPIQQTRILTSIADSATDFILHKQKESVI